MTLTNLLSSVVAVVVAASLGARVGNISRMPNFYSGKEAPMLGFEPVGGFNQTYEIISMFALVGGFLHLYENVWTGVKHVVCLIV